VSLTPLFLKKDMMEDQKKSKLKILVVPANEGGCAYYRLILPAQKLAELYPDQVEIKFNLNPLGLDTETGKMPSDEDHDWSEFEWADIVWTQNISNFGGQYTARVVGKGKEFGKFVHYDTDDLLTDLYKGHRLHGVYKDRKLGEVTKFIYANSDLVTVTQRKFADRIRKMCGGVLAVVKNSIDYNLPCWNAPKTRSLRKKLLRVGWAGGIHHEEDVKEFAGVPHFVNGRVGRENVFWDFYGCPLPDPEGAVGWQHEVWLNYKRILLKGFKGAKNWNIHYAKNPNEYGTMFANMDIAIAPLQMNAFNDSKSEIKVAECGRYKVPLIASNVGCYDETIINGETGYLLPPNATKSDWVKVLTKCIKNPKHVREMGENLHKVTEEYFNINTVVKHRLELYEQSFGLLSDRNEKETYNKEWQANV